MNVKWKKIFQIGLISFMSTCVSGFVIYNTIYDTSELKTKGLAASRTVLIYVCFNADGIIRAINRDRFLSALNYLHNYDNSAKFKEIQGNKILSFSTFIRIFLIIFWVIMLGLCYTTARGSYRENINVIYGPFMSLQIIKFSDMIMKIYRRFNHLNNLISSKGK